MSSSQLFVLITHEIKPEKLDFFLHMLANKVSVVRHHEGCELLSIYEGVENPNKVIAFQVWETQAHWLSHIQSSAAKELTMIGSEVTTAFSIEKLVLHDI